MDSSPSPPQRLSTRNADENNPPSSLHDNKTTLASPAVSKPATLGRTDLSPPTPYASNLDADDDNLPFLPDNEPSIISTTTVTESAEPGLTTSSPSTSPPADSETAALATDGVASIICAENTTTSPLISPDFFDECDGLDLWPSTPRPALIADDGDLPPMLFLENITTTPIALNTAPNFAGPGQVDGSRTAILRDLGSSISEVPFQFFKDNILPQLPGNAQVPTVLERLADRGHIVDGRWKAFPRDPYMYAKKSGGSTDYDLGEKEREKENAVFAHLATVIDAIEECVEGKQKMKRKKMTTKQRAKSMLSGTTEYESSPDKVPVCCFDEKTGRPDAYFVFKQRFLDDREDGRRLWRDIAATAEFKLKDTRETLQDDVKKICWNLYKTMLEDPRRRFVFGFTIENTQTRIWTGNRTEVLVSEPFNFITDHEKLVHFFLSMLYGSETELGLDPTMMIFSASGNAIPRYDIQVRVMDESTKQIDILTYRTTELLNDDGAKSFRGSGTRAWEVVPVVNGIEQPDIRHVLKDHWVDDDRQREGAILDEILNDPNLGDTAREELKELFLTQVARGDVYITDGNGEHETIDGTRTLATRGAEIPKGAARFYVFVPADYKTSHARKSTQKGSGRYRGSERDKKGATGDIVHGEAAAIANKSQLEEGNVIVYRSKHHHRIVFAQRCKPLSQEQSLRCVFIALRDITTGIAFMHMCGPGWVHRDISTGNIHILLGRRAVKLADLEYARRLDTQYKHTLRTGTVNFMAVEVDQGAYLFYDEPREIRQVDDILDDFAAFRKQVRADSPPPTRESDTESSSSPTPEPATRNSSSPQSTRRRPFFYNPLHDLESIWWIAVYFVISKETALASSKRTRSGVTDKITYSRLTEDQRKYARSLFHDLGTRVFAIRSSDNSPLDDRLRALPGHLSDIVTELIDLRQKISARYQQIEQPDFVIDKMAAKPLYPLFFRAFDKIVRLLLKQDISVAPLKPDPEEELRKGVRAAQRAAETYAPSRPAKRRKLDDATSGSTSTTTKPANLPKKVHTTTKVGRSRNRTVDHAEPSDAPVAIASSSRMITRSAARTLVAEGANVNNVKAAVRTRSAAQRKR